VLAPEGTAESDQKLFLEYYNIQPMDVDAPSPAAPAASVAGEDEADADLEEPAQDEAEPPDATDDPASGAESPSDIVVGVSQAELERTRTLRELRDMCSAQGLPTTGKKSDLARRLVARS
jgi:hypothetical protein